MLSKSKGQVLRVAAAMHILFSPDDIDEELSPLPNTITTCALIAAINYVDTCCQHGAFIAGRGKVDDEIKSLTSGGTDYYTSHMANNLPIYFVSQL